MQKSTHLIKIVSFLIWGLLLICNHLYGQERVEKISDSLKDKSYRYLYGQLLKDTKDTLVSKIYLNAYLDKATLENDFNNKSLALNLLSGYAANDVDKLAFIKQSVIEGNKAKGDSVYSIASYLSLGAYYYYRSAYENAIDQYLIALRLAIKNNNRPSEISALRNIAIIKSDIGNHKDALQLLRKCYFIEKSKKEINNYTHIKMTLNLSESLRLNKQYDSASYYYNTVIDTSRKYNNYHLGRLLINEGINLYQKNDLKKSENLLREGVLINTGYEKHDILAYFYLGKIFYKKDKEKGNQYFLKVDSLISKNDLVLPEIKEVYTSLISYYGELNNDEKKLYFLAKLARFNELNASKTLEISERLNAKFDIPQLLLSRDKLIKSLRVKNSTLTVEKTILIALLFVIAVIIIRQYRDQIKYRKRFEEIIGKERERESSSKTTTQINAVQKLNIDSKVVEDILGKLKTFESNKGFLKNTVTITSLARKLSTNTKYLSKVINNHKNKSFITYINDLRIDYILGELQYNEVFQRYTIAGIADEIGFNSADSFSSAFKKNTGITPSYYIKKIKKLKSVIQ